MSEVAAGRPDRWVRALRGLGVALLVACAGAGGAPPGWLERLSRAPVPAANDNLPLPADQLERLMAAGDPEWLQWEEIGHGVTGAYRIRVRYPGHPQPFDIKWKPALPGADGWNNSPRKELAAYRIQTWFLQPRDYVVPPTRMRCVPLELHRRLDEDSQPSFEGTRCVLGMEAVWLQNVGHDRLYREEEFYRDAAYARHLANFNLLTYLIEHHDTFEDNVVVSNDPTNRRVYSIDNGIAFGGKLYNFLIPHWDRIRVPALPRDSVDALYRVRPEHLEALAVVFQMQRGADGMLREVRPGLPVDRDDGAVYQRGVLQLGLEEDEIEDVAERLEDLLEDASDGDIPLF